MSRLCRGIILSVLSVSLISGMTSCGYKNEKESVDINKETEIVEKDNVLTEESELNDLYERDATSGKIIDIKLDDAISMVENGETGIILFSVSTCKDCIILNAILDEYLVNHNITINNVVLDNEGNSQEEIQKNREKINTVFPNFNSTPSTYYVKEGKTLDEILYVKTYEEFDQWVIKNKLDEKIKN